MAYTCTLVAEARYVILAAALATSGIAQETLRPEALLRLEEARSRLENGRIEVHKHSGDRPKPGLFQTARFAGSDRALLTSPDAGAGGAAGTESAPIGMLEPTGMRQLRRDNEVWFYPEDGLSVTIGTAERPIGNIPDFRCLGVLPFVTFDDLPMALWKDGDPLAPPRTYGERIENGLHVVTAHSAQGDVTWWIDPERGWNAVRVIGERDGKIFGEARIALRKFGDVWYPESTAYFSSAYKDGHEPKTVYRVLSAEFNQPGHPPRLTPQDIGVEAGMWVNRSNAKPGATIEFFDGERVISNEEMIRWEKAGEIKRGPTNLRALAKGDAFTLRHALCADREHLDLWTRYVRDFIIRYRLESDQIDRACTILHQCQDKAANYVAGRKDKFAELAKQADALAEADPPDVDKQRVLSRKKADVLQPINDIFENELKPRLEKLPTRVQRKAADSQPASQPK